MSIKILFAHVNVLLRDLLRTPAYVVPGILFPAMFYGIFGMNFARGNPAAANQILTSFVAFAIVGVTLFQFGVSVAMERGRPWERYLRSLPVRVETRFVARIIVAIAMALAAAGLIAILARLFTPITLTAMQWAQLGAYALLGAVPFVVLGLAVAYVAPPRGALPIVNIIYLLGSVAGGFWMPLEILPHFVTVISPYVPMRQYGELLWGVTLPGHNAAHAAMSLAYFTLAFAAIAIFGYRRDEKARYA